MATPPTVPSEINLVKVTVRTNPRLLPPVCALVRETALEGGFSSAEAMRLELMAEEACLVVMEQAFRGRDDASFDLRIVCRPRQVVLLLEDAGVPFDLMQAETDDATQLSVRMLHALADEVNFINRGNKGVCIELVKDLSAPSSEPGFLPLEDVLDEVPGAPPVSDEPVDVRPMRPDDAMALARCMYYVYGNTYREFVYFPEKIRDLLIAGKLYSTVAVTANGEVVAHQGLMRERAGDPVAEVGMGVVDPRFRGRRLFETLKKESYAAIAAQGVYGLYVEAVTVHPYSQKANTATGARDTGILLNYILAELDFKTFPGARPQRQAVVWFYVRIGEEPERTLFLPPRHAAIIAKIYAGLGLRRILQPLSAAPDVALAEVSELDVVPSSEWGYAVLRVAKPGRDVSARLRAERDRLCSFGFDVLYVDLPLGDPATSRVLPDIEALGFSFAAVAPELLDGDALRLQYLNSPCPDPSTIFAVSPMAKELLDYVCANLPISVLAE